MSKSLVSKASVGSTSLNALYSSGRAAARLKLVRNPEDAQTVEGTEEFLCEVVDACASSVAVLDESGAILYASKSWQLFEQSYQLTADLKAITPDVFAHCLRVDHAVLTNNARAVSLRENVQLLISGKQKEFQGTYSYPDFARQIMARAARLNLP